MENIQQIATILGLDTEIGALAQLDKIVKDGLPKRSFDKMVDTLFSGEKKEDAIAFKQHIVPRGYSQKKTLTAFQTKQAVRIAEIYARAIEVFGQNEDLVRVFLLKPHKVLHNEKPIYGACTDRGVLQVENLLGRIYYGIPF